MLGWEFPPFFAGGAGIVCNELSKSLNEQGIKVTFVMPRGPEDKLREMNKQMSHLKILTANSVENNEIKTHKLDTLVEAYMGWEEYTEKYKMFTKKEKEESPYGKNLKEEVERFASLIEEIAKQEDFDVIHAHDWVTFLAGCKVKEVTGKPLIIHVHITEFDKSGGQHANPYIYSIEKLGMEKADKIIAVSEKVKNRCIHNYFQDEGKIKVVHNAATPMNDKIQQVKEFKGNDKIVLFAGRITLQKGPEYFIEAAHRALKKEPNIKFIVAGTGDKLPALIEDVDRRGLSHKFVFTGFYTRDEAEKIFSMADVFVMPSVSEPFGVVPYEAQIKKTPTIISKQSGISEVLNHTLKVDFWDTRKMADMMLGLLEYSELHEEMKEQGYKEAKTANWKKPAEKCIEIYNEMVN